MFACSIYQQGKKIATPTLAETGELMQAPDAFAWVRLDAPTPALLHELQQVFALHELAVEDAASARQRPKLEAYGEVLFLVVRTAHLHEGLLISGELHLFLGPRFLIAIHHGEGVDEPDIERRREQLASKLSLGPMFAAYVLLDAIVDRYALLLEELRGRFEALEASVFEEDIGREKLEQSYRLKRQLMTLSDAVTPIADICADLMRLHDEAIPRALKVYLRDVQDHCVRVAQGANNMREMLMAAMQINLALVSIGQNDTSRKLAGWAAVLAIPTMVFGLYGMNFVNMPELQWRYGYFVTLGVVVLTCTLVYRRLHKAGWI